jgi:hypothetical protein
MNDNEILKEKAKNFVLTLNELNSLLKIYMKSDSPKLKTILKRLTEVSLFRISLPHKLIDTLLVLLIRLLEILSKQELLESDVLSLVNKLLTLDSILVEFSSKKDYLVQKWQYLSQVLLIYINSLYVKENTKENNVEIKINEDLEKELFYFIEYIFFDLPQQYQFEVIPCVFSKLVNYLGKQDNIYVGYIKIGISVLYECLSIIILIGENIDLECSSKKFKMKDKVTGMSKELELIIKKNIDFNKLISYFLNTYEYLSKFIFFTFEMMFHNKNYIFENKFVSLSEKLLLVVNKAFSIKPEIIKGIIKTNEIMKINNLNQELFQDFVLVSVRLVNMIIFKGKLNTIQNSLFFNKTDGIKHIEIKKIKV